jgi:hypothetical protein
MPASNAFAAFELFRHLVGFLKNALHRGAGLSLRRLPDRSKNLLQPLYLALGFGPMRVKRESKLFGIRHLGHLSQRSQDLLLRRVDVLEHFDKEIIQCFITTGHVFLSMRFHEKHTRENWGSIMRELLHRCRLADSGIAPQGETLL